MTRPIGRHILAATAAFTISLALAGCAPRSFEAATNATRTPTVSPSATPKNEMSSAPKPEASKEVRLGFGPEDLLENGAEPAWSISISDLERAGWTMNGDDSDPSAGRWSFDGPNDGIAILQQQRIDDLDTLPASSQNDAAATRSLLSAGGLTGKPVSTELERFGGGSVEFLASPRRSPRSRAPRSPVCSRHKASG